MFYSFQNRETARIPAAELQNPVHHQNGMDLSLFNAEVSTAFYSTSKPFEAFYDTTTQKRIPRKSWTNHMKNFAQQQRALHPSDTKSFKVNYGTYIMLALFVIGAVVVVWENQKNKAAVAKMNYEASYMPEHPKAGDIFYGNYYHYKEGSRLTKDFRFTWAKVVAVQGDVYDIALAKEFSKKAVNETTLNSNDFETETMPMQITKQDKFQITFKNKETLQEFTAGKKKE